jgi:hypothetical protein
MENDRGVTRQQRKALERENKSWPVTLKQVPKDQWPQSSLSPERQPMEVWRSRDFLVQVFAAIGADRLSIIRTSHTGKSWAENITWDEIQRLKSEIGRGHMDAVEIYPADKDVVNVANMRHIFVLHSPFPLTWR